MKKILALILLNFTILSLAVSPVSAAYDFKQNSGINDVAPIMGYDANSEMTPEYYIGVVLSLIFSAMGLIFLILIIYAGINWMTAQGNTSQVDKAKNTIVKVI